jgi:4'-phosphopantetheinyl transferase
MRLADAVHVWRIPLATSAERRRALAMHLSESERARAMRLRFDHDRERYVVAHGALRALLSAYVARPPAAIRFLRGELGKPSIDASDLGFSFSRSGDLALCAIARGRAVGIDVEQRRAASGLAELARLCFSPLEIATLERLPAARRADAFLAGWTRKEAYLKGRGTGLAVPLDDFDVSIAPDAPARLLASRRHADDPARWMLLDLSPATGYAAALAMDGGCTRVVRLSWGDHAPC